MRPLRLTALALSAGLAAAACSDAGRPELTAVTQPPTTITDASTTTGAPTTSAAEAQPAQPAAPNSRVYPAVPGTSESAGERLYEVEQLIHTIDPEDATWPDLAHEQQMLYRRIGRHPEWILDIIESAPAEYAPIIELHLSARRSIAGIGGGQGEPPKNVPAWEIIEPLPAADLRVLYEQAGESSGIHWTFLAAINLLETGFGRIDGLSTAGAQGPMQFLPSTFDEVSDGDIDDPADAIAAAARYLVRRGGPGDMHAALRGYNNSDAYVAAVTHYANLFRNDERSFLATHAWEIHYSAAIGDLWFPVGYREEEAQPTADYLETAPWSAPPPSS